MTPKTKLERILFATDLLENSRLALDYAVVFAEHFKATIVMLHVLQLSGAAHEAELTIAGPSVSRKTAEQRLNTLAQGVRRLGVNVETDVVDGLTCEVILNAVVRHKADLLVLGIHGVHRGLEHLLIGSNTEKILLSANCPVLTVGAHVLTGFDLKLHLQEILYFSDFTPEATAAAPFALQMGKEFAVPVELCLLLPQLDEDDEQSRKQLADDYCKTMREVLEGEEPDWGKPAFQLERGMALDQIIERAETQSAGFIVLGVHTESQLGRHLRSSFAYQVLAQATCPILTIRHEGERSSEEPA